MIIIHDEQCVGFENSLHAFFFCNRKSMNWNWNRDMQHFNSNPRIETNVFLIYGDAYMRQWVHSEEFLNIFTMVIYKGGVISEGIFEFGSIFKKSHQITGTLDCKVEGQWFGSFFWRIRPNWKYFLRSHHITISFAKYNPLLFSL